MSGHSEIRIEIVNTTKITNRETRIEKNKTERTLNKEKEIEKFVIKE